MSVAGNAAGDGEVCAARVRPDDQEVVFALKALMFTNSIPRYLAGKALGRLWPEFYWSGLSCLQYREVSPPPLPGRDWVRVKTRYAGICGSDLGLVRLNQSPSTSPFASFPFVVGHENVGVIVECGEGVPGFAVGDRVVVDPMLACAPRGIEPPCPACRAGDLPRCHNFTAGDLAPGMLLGGCRDTGGSWSPEFVAHRSQLFPVPEMVKDTEALMAEPLASVLRAVLRRRPRAGQTCLVIGAGVMGLLVVGALRALGSEARVVTLARHPHQAAIAREWGAEVVPGGRGQLRRLAEALGVRLLRPMIGPPVLGGGFDVVFDCAGSSGSLDTALRCAAPGGEVVLLGLATFPRGLDWSFVWRNELRLSGCFCYGVEEHDGRLVRAHQLALELIAARRARPGQLISHIFPLPHYRRALAVLADRRHSGALKVLFEFPP